MGDSHMALQARLMSQALRKLTAVVSRTQTSVVFINQLRQKIGIVYGNPETTTGGNALKFYATVRLDIRKIGRGEERRRGRRQQDPRQGGQEQGRAAVPRGGVRDPLRRRGAQAR
jgi:RecA/RadA recombinase